MPLTVSEFLQRWKGSAGNERANKDSFLRDFSEALNLPPPEPKDAASAYCFEKDLKITHLDGSTSTGSIDLFKAGCFVLEAKQGSTKAKPGSSPLRGTRAYDQYMERAFGQAVNYAIRLPQRPPFVLTCDIGHAFHVWEGFSGTYGGYGARRTILLDDLFTAENQIYLRALWMDPQSLDPGRRRALVTRQVAGELGDLAKALETRFPAQAVAAFLMRCVFTFFAEDVGLLPEKLFEKALGNWKARPELFVKGLESLWDAMNTGNLWGPDQLLRFNGGLFAEHLALALTADEIALLYRAAHYEWDEVDPSIFGTLLESALSPDERHRLGAHYTPRAYIERLIRPAIEEPLRADWDLVQAEALALLGAEPDEAARAKARAVLHAFRQNLANTTVLDPACGSGNFLYVAYDLLKRLEQEVLSRLSDLGETRQALQLDQVTVTPAHFLGLEIKPWAAAIAELVLWIGHLQWWRRLHPTGSPPEPVLQRYDNIQNRDAVLVWKGARDTGRSRWDGKTFKTHPVTGKAVPDDAAQTAIVELVNPRPAAWPEADFIVGNPPFIGNKRMRDALGDGYAEALRAAYPEVPDSVDFVLYWWHKAAEAVRSGRTRRFGLITTNSLTQTFNRRVIAHHCSVSLTVPHRFSLVKKKRTGEERGGTVRKEKEIPGLKLLWAIPDHPWTDAGAAVRIAMTVGGLEGHPWLGHVIEEHSADTPEAEAEAVKVEGQGVDVIHEDLSAGADVASALPLKANSGLCGQGMKIVGDGFYDHHDLSTSILSPTTGVPVVRTIQNAQDIIQGRPGRKIIDFFGLTETQAMTLHPAAYQQAHDEVLPIRRQNSRASIRDLWWRFAWERPVVRGAIKGLGRYLVTLSVSKHRFFVPIPEEAIWDGALFAIASSDAFHMGVLSSRVHLAWALAAGGRMGVGNDPTWTNSHCFDPFPFPDATEPQKARIRDLAERLDAHRKAAQGRGVTITQMYNLLVKLRSGEAFTPKERDQHAAAQTEILRQLHDELDAAVIEAYGWSSNQEKANTDEHREKLINTDSSPEDHSFIGVHRCSSVVKESFSSVALSDAEILERLVALNRERAEEEKRGLVRWLRPEYQAPEKSQPIAQPMISEIESPADLESVAPLEPQPWPKDLKDQLAALRTLLLSNDRLWTLEAVAAAFKSRGRYRDGIQAQLDLLADLRVIERLDGPQPRWHRPQAVGA
ncbi:MAG: hypothetical protein Q8K67_02535 [Geothrix sp.]|nr:hypothetical protein [Geothrix sp.]